MNTTHPRMPRVERMGPTARFVPARAMPRPYILALGEPATGMIGAGNDRYCSILRVTSVNYNLLSDEEKTGVINAFWGMLLQLSFPMQIIIRERPINLEPYLADQEARVNTAHRGDHLAQRIFADEARFIRRISSSRTLLSREFAIALFDDVEERDMASALSNALMSRKNNKAMKAVRRQREAQETLISRINQARIGLNAVGLRADVLIGDELVQFYKEMVSGAAEVVQGRGMDDMLMPRVEKGKTPIPPEPVDSEPFLPDGESSRALPDRSEEQSAPVQKNNPLAFLKRFQHSSEPVEEDLYMLSLSEYLAPAVVKVQARHLIVDDMFARVISLDGYPRHLYAGWMAKILDAGIPMDIALHIAPRNSQVMLSHLNRKLARYISSELTDRKQGKIADYERQVAQRDTEELRDALQRGEEKVAITSMYFLVRAPTLSDLNEQTDRLLNVLKMSSFVSKPIVYQQEQALRSVLPNRDEVGRKTLLNSASIATAFPFISANFPMQHGAFYGIAGDGSLIAIDPFSPQMDNANHVVFAKSGSGKSYLCKAMALRHYLTGIRIAVIDPENEWTGIAGYVKGQLVRIAAGSDYHLNPFDLMAVDPDDTIGMDPLAEKIVMLTQFLGMLLASKSGEELSAIKRSYIERALFMVYETKGITRDMATHEKTPPILSDLYDLIESGACGPDEHQILQQLYSYVHGAQNTLFNAQTNIDLANPFVVFNVRDVEGRDRANAIFVITEFIWRQMRKESPERRQPRLLFIDEAWTLLRYAEGSAFLGAMARRARKYYLGLITISQDVKEFLEHEESRIVINNSSVVILLKQTSSSIQEVGTAFHLRDGEKTYLLQCEKGQGILLALQSRVTLTVRASEHEHQLITTDPREIADQATHKEISHDNEREF